MDFSAVLLRKKIKTTIGILIFGAMLWMFPPPVAALQTALLRASDGSVYQIRFRNIDPGSRDYLRDFIRDFSIYDQIGQV